MTGKMRKFKAAVLALVMAVSVTAVTAQAKEAVVIPKEVVELSEELGRQYNICPELIQAVCWTESRCKPDVVGGPCLGIMQIYEKWHRGRMDRLGVTDIYDMRQNMLVGVDYLSELFDKYEDAAPALAAYHGEKDVYSVSAYTKGILELSERLEREHGK